MAGTSVLERLVVEIVGDTRKLKSSLEDSRRQIASFSKNATASVAVGAKGSGLAKMKGEASEAQKAITGLTSGLDILISDQKLGNVTSAEYAAGLGKIAAGAKEASNSFTLTAGEMKQLASVYAKASREQATLGGSTEGVRAQVKALVSEIRILRNDWQKTGAATKQTKARLAELVSETSDLQAALMKADGGFERFNGEIARLATAGRSAEATIAGIEGRMSRLGIASQVNLAMTQSLGAAMYRFGPAGMVMANGIQAGGMAMAKLGLGATVATAGIAGVGLAAAALVRQGIPQVEQFQKALQLLISTGNDLTQSQLTHQLDLAAAAAGKAGTQFARGQLAESLSLLVKAGLSASQAMRLLAPSMQLAVESDQSLTEASTRLLQNLRSFGYGTIQAQRAADDLAKASLIAAANAQQLSEGLSTIGPVAKQSGLTLESTLGALVTLANAGLDPATKGGNAFRVVMTSLLKPTKQAQGALEALGVATRDSAGHQRDMQSILSDLVKSAATFGISIDKTTGQVVGQQDAIAELARIFRTRGITAIAALAEAQRSGLLTWADYTQMVKEGQGELKSYADTLLSNNLGAATKGLQVANQNLAESFTLALAPGIITTETAWAQWISRLAGVQKPVTDVVTSVNALVSSLAGVQTAADLQGILDGLDKKLTGDAKSAFDKWRESIDLTKLSLSQLRDILPTVGAASTQAILQNALQKPDFMHALRSISPGEMNLYGLHLGGGKNAQALSSQLSSYIGQGDYAHARILLSTVLNEQRNWVSLSSRERTAIEDFITVLDNATAEQTAARIKSAQAQQAAAAADRAAAAANQPASVEARIAKARSLYNLQAGALSSGSPAQVIDASRQLQDWLAAGGDKATSALRQEAYNAVQKIMGSVKTGASDALASVKLTAPGAKVTYLPGLGTYAPTGPASQVTLDRLLGQPFQASQQQHDGARSTYNAYTRALWQRTQAERLATVAAQEAAAASRDQTNALEARNRITSSLADSTMRGDVALYGRQQYGIFKGTLGYATGIAQGNEARYQAAEVGAQQVRGFLSGALSLYQRLRGAGQTLGQAVLDGLSAVEDRAIRQRYAAAAGFLQGGPAAPIPGTSLANGFSAPTYPVPARNAADSFRMGQQQGSYGPLFTTDQVSASNDAARTQIKAAQDAADKQKQAANQFAMTVVQAGGSFAQALINGSPGGIVSGGLGAAGSILGAIPDFAAGPLIGTVVGVVGSIFGGLLSAGGSRMTSENSAAAAQMRASATPPALDIRFTVEQNYKFDAFNDPATQAQMRASNDQMFQQFQQVLAKSIIPRLNRLDRAVGLSS